MNRPVNHLVDVANLRALAGNHDQRIDDLQAAIRRMDSIVGTWRTFGVRPRSLQDAENTCEGLRRALIDLRAEEAGNDEA